MKRHDSKKTRSAKFTPVIYGRKLPRHFELTHESRIMFPGAGITKGELLHYYERVSKLLLPELRGRPVTLERAPEGLAGSSFWQKNTPGYYPDWIPRVVLPSERGKPVSYCLVNDVETLLYLVNQGAVTFHTYLSTIGNLDCPDHVIFDLDPGRAGMKDVVKVAHAVRGVLAERELECDVKTSGGAGLHVRVSWSGEGGYDEARAWAVQIAKDVVIECGSRATLERLKSKRGGRVYIDVIQNAKGHHVVPPYVVRLTPQATVSTPLDWSEVNARLDPTRFTVRNALERFGLARGRRAA